MLLPLPMMFLSDDVKSDGGESRNVEPAPPMMLLTLSAAIGL